MQTHLYFETKGRPRHGAGQLAKFSELDDTALTSSFVAEMLLGKSRSSIDTLRREGRLEFVKEGRNVRIRVGSIRTLLRAGQ
ncbi:MAG TPA: hypothetical protein VHZ95_11495 [Polyangiales bacterium]|nr:hypothetical protein [Polyangiales bacterium]